MNRRKTPEATGERISIGHGEESDEGVRTFKHVLAELSVNDKQEHRDVVFHTLLHPTGFPSTIRPSTHELQLITSVHHPQSHNHCPILHPLSSRHNPPSSVFQTTSFLLCLPSFICHPPSAAPHLPITILHPVSIILHTASFPLHLLSSTFKTFFPVLYPSSVIFHTPPITLTPASSVLHSFHLPFSIPHPTFIAHHLFPSLFPPPPFMLPILFLFLLL